MVRQANTAGTERCYDFKDDIRGVCLEKALIGSVPLLESKLSFLAERSCFP